MYAGHRSAERESMEKLKKQFGEHLMPDGQSFRKGTVAADLVDEALSAFGDAVLVTTAVIREATGRMVEPADVAREAGIPIPTPRPVPVPTPRPVPAPTSRPELETIEPEAAPQPSGIFQQFLDGMKSLAPVSERQAQELSIIREAVGRPTPTQDVRITNPTPIHAPINVTVYATTNADPGTIASQVGARVQAALTSHYSDGALGE